MQVGFYISMFIFGTAMGSFLMCQAWRLKYRTHCQSLGQRSICLACRYQLQWFDNLPLISWLCLKGKCRKCGAKIGIAEILTEILLGLIFLGLSTTININTATPLTWVLFGLEIIFTLLISFLAIYDGKWGELPETILTFSTICAIILSILKQWNLFSNFSFLGLMNIIGSVLILGGTYWLLYVFSKGKWVGNGDFILGISLGLAIGDTWLALIILFIANLLGFIIMAPTKQHKVHLGPFLVIAFFIVSFFPDFFWGLIGF